MPITLSDAHRKLLDGKNFAYLATLGSHRVSNDAPMVRDGTDAAIIRARLGHAERSVLLDRKSKVLNKKC